MLRLFLFTLTALLFVTITAIAQADVSIYIEDFEDEQGNAGFDPLFNHSFSRDSGEPNWDLREEITNPSYPGDVMLGLWPAQDTITFNLAGEQSIIFASVEMSDGGGNSTAVFIGEAGSTSFQCPTSNITYKFAVNSDEIGFIRQIVLSSSEGGFDNIEIKAIPEPNSFLFAAMLSSFALLFRQFRGAV